MEQIGVISRVDVPTQWCTKMVVVPKTDRKIRICVDLTRLNSSVQQERYPIPPVDHIPTQLGGAKIFSKLDPNCGFWQINLHKDSFGRFHFNRLPFGFMSVQKYINKVLSGLEAVICMMDDVLVYESDREEHDHRLRAVLEHLQQAKVTLNKDKCSFYVNSVRFLGHIIVVTLHTF